MDSGSRRIIEWAPGGLYRINICITVITKKKSTTIGGGYCYIYRVL